MLERGLKLENEQSLKEQIQLVVIETLFAAYLHSNYSKKKKEKNTKEIGIDVVNTRILRDPLLLFLLAGAVLLAGVVVVVAAGVVVVVVAAGAAGVVVAVVAAGVVAGVVVFTGSLCG